MSVLHLFPDCLLVLGTTKSLLMGSCKHKTWPVQAQTQVPREGNLMQKKIVRSLALALAFLCAFGVAQDRAPVGAKDRHQDREQRSRDRDQETDRQQRSIDQET